MAAVTDLTWTQLNSALKQVLGVSSDIIYLVQGEESHLAVDFPLLAGGANSMNSEGVIKAFSILLEAARRAQETANTGKATGERLSAFPAPVNGTPANNFVPVTRSMTARADLSSATKIVGTNA